MSQDFRRAIEEIKLRAPIEDVVREYIPTLKKAGSLWTACCPFHQEKSPSFKVDPRRGTWHCYGACAEGGDQIAFLERFSGLQFIEAMEILAARTGVEMPKMGGRDREEKRKDDPAIDMLKRATEFYAKALYGSEGRQALKYLLGRGLSEETIERFCLGWSPANGRELVGFARDQGLGLELLERGGLARKNDSGHGYDFFRGRLMIPIRDLDGRTVGFGARRLGDDGGGPKYINTPETPLFKKSQLVYGFDLALLEARRERHVILMEGYTDVMAAHQVGLTRVGAVLGTSTTDSHAKLVRRAGARRVSLVFDGDEAGGKAAKRALHGLVPLDIEIQIVRLPKGADPCDLLLADGADAFMGLVDAALDWFALLCSDLAGKRGAELSEAVDEILELVTRVKRPVHRSSLIQELAETLSIPVDDLREQWRTSTGGRRRPKRQAAVQNASASSSSDEDSEAEAAAYAQDGDDAGPNQEPVIQAPEDPILRKLFAEMVGAVLLDASLVPLVRPHSNVCKDEDLSRILEVVLEMYEDLDAVINTSSVLTALGDHPARKKVASLAEYASSAASPKELLEGSLNSLRRRNDGRREAQLKAEFLALEQQIFEAADEVAQTAAQAEQERVLLELNEVLRLGRIPTDESEERDVETSVSSDALSPVGGVSTPDFPQTTQPQTAQSQTAQ
ncbi:MAG: DNA primase [Planctomycetota bacterium]